MLADEQGWGKKKKETCQFAQTWDQPSAGLPPWGVKPPPPPPGKRGGPSGCLPSFCCSPVLSSGGGAGGSGWSALTPWFSALLGPRSSPSRGQAACVCLGSFPLPRGGYSTTCAVLCLSHNFMRQPGLTPSEGSPCGTSSNGSMSVSFFDWQVDKDRWGSRQVVHRAGKARHRSLGALGRQTYNGQIY